VNRLLKLLLDPWGCQPCPRCAGLGTVDRDLLAIHMDVARYGDGVSTSEDCSTCAGSGIVAYKWSAAVLEGAEFEGES
jgi:DnaJ-class molecular chaperone